MKQEPNERQRLERVGWFRQLGAGGEVKGWHTWKDTFCRERR